MNNKSRGEKALWVVFFVLVAVFIFLCFQISSKDKRQDSVPTQGVPTQEARLVYVRQFDLYRAVFTEPVESMLFFFRDGKVLLFTTLEEARVNVYPGVLMEHFRAVGRNIGDVLLIIHNHLYPSRFSPGDKFVYRYLTEQGFVGVFGIYYPSTGNVIWYNEDE